MRGAMMVAVLVAFLMLALFVVMAMPPDDAEDGGAFGLLTGR